MVVSNLTVQALDKYRLLEQIGRGGMATVYKAFDPEAGREVAIKVLSPVMAQEDQFSKRFAREAEVVMGLSHPNIVPVIDYGQDAGYAYLVMPLLQVGSLADRLVDGPLTPAQGGRLLAQLSSALDFAHQQGIVHRDVKPSNVLLDEQGNALLADFGLARIHDASVSLTGSALLGTPAYMSPEQARGERVGPASDQYSLGVILYQLCTGNLPFEAETPMAVMLKHINEPLPLVRANSPNVPEPIEHVILKATAKNPEDRFGTVLELDAAFQAALAHAQDPFANPAPRIELPPSSVALPVEAASGSETDRRRSRLGRLAAAAALLLLLLLTCPTAFPSLVDRIADEFIPAEGSGLSPEEMSAPQLTALAGTIEALSTQLAASGEGTHSPDQIQTAVMQTLAAGGDPFADPSETPGAFLVGDGTPTGTATPGASPTPSLSPTPGPSPTPSKTPTITYTPSPGPSPTPSNTPTPSKTPTATHTASPGPSSTASKTPTPPPPAATQTPTSGLSGSTTPVASGSPGTPTSSPVPITTSTPLTFPIDTPTIDPCMGIKFDGFRVAIGGNIVEATITNGSPFDIRISSIYFDWPKPNIELRRIDLDDREIWNKGDTEPPTSISGGDFKGDGNDREIQAGSSAVLEAEFDIVNSGSYYLKIYFTNGCSISS